MLELEIAKKAAAAGGQVVAGYFRRDLRPAQKGAGQTYNLVSQADVESEQAVVSVIREAFPGHAVLAEEAHQADTDSEHLWVIDPLDGTNNFLHHVPHFAVSVAYYRGGEAVCGVVYNPVRDDWYQAVRGRGATYQDAPIRVSDAQRLDEVLVGVGFYYDRGALMQATLTAVGELFRCNIHGIRRFGTASLDLAAVASGAFGGFFEYRQAPWDFAAGRLLVEEAGGRVTTCRGGPLPLAPTTILAAPPPLHAAMLPLVERHLPRGELA